MQWEKEIKQAFGHSSLLEERFEVESLSALSNYFSCPQKNFISHSSHLCLWSVLATILL